MPGQMWWLFREGTRAEYLAQLLFSSVGLAVRVPCDEDIGADFHCSVVKVDGNRMTFDAPFIVQIKGTKPQPIRYGGKDKKGRWQQEQVE